MQRQPVARTIGCRLATTTKEEDTMAIWKCAKCGHEKDGRCKPRKCPQCNAADSFAKQ